MLEMLLDEMVLVEEQVLYLVFFYICCQESSYDCVLVLFDFVGWFVNSDGFGIKWVDMVVGCIEKVMFDEVGFGVIICIWIIIIDKWGIWWFYFDGFD